MAKDEYEKLRLLIYDNYGGYSMSDSACEDIVQICKKILQKRKKKPKNI